MTDTIAERGALEPRLQRLSSRIVTGDGERETMEILNPATGQVQATVPRCTEADVEAAVRRARGAQERWRSTSFAQRRAILLRFHDLVLAQQSDLLDIVQLESGKARRHAFEEILDVAIVSRYYANTAERHLRTQRRRGALPVLTATWEHHHPVGVVGVIAPWNYPLTLSISDAIPALAAGNAVVLKVDSQTPFAALAGQELLERAGLDPELLQIVTGAGSDLGPALIDRVDYVMFTGSTAVGRQVASQAAERLIPSSMELGGKNAMLVLHDADLDRAVDGAERAMFSNGGQLCISAERLLVDERIADAFIAKLVERVRGMQLGAELSYASDMGSLISQKQFDTVCEHVEDAVTKGAKVLTGGPPAPGPRPVLLRADAPRRRPRRDDAVRGGDVRPGGGGLALQDGGRGGRDRERRPLRPQLQRLDTRHPPRPVVGHAPAGGDRERQRGLHRHLGVRRRADGRDEGLGARPPPRRGRHPQVHGVPDRLRAAADADRPAAPRERRRLRGGDDRRAAPAAPHPRHPLIVEVG